MALMLAPYNSAMRLGMGFNSYTQALCVNDVVRKPGSIPATEDDLRAAQLTERTDAAAQASSQQLALTSQQPPPSTVLEGAQGTVKRTIVDGQKEVSQVVSWEATFVESGSDVLKKLEISGALSIQMEALGQVSGKAAFVDSDEMKKADVKYLIHVKVINQRLIADNITEFCPIENIEPGQFTEIYGDCFISGFIEGGEFDALVTITTEDTQKKNSLSGELKVDGQIAGVKVGGQIAGAKEESSVAKNAKTDIRVTWSGGGDIRADHITEWNVNTLKEVAMSFPDAVAACPQRISAILTKYTSLRSFHTSTKKGSPLDYENAGVYTAALYDAYTDYKLMWKEVQAMISALNRKELALYGQTPSEGLAKYAERIANAYSEKVKRYEDAMKDQEKHRDRTALIPFSGPMQALQPIEKPLPMNEMKSYGPDVFGLESAATDCRFEMIKIVREVNAVTKDPKVACDPTRTNQYLSPSVFRLLLPTPHPGSLPTYDEWDAQKVELQKTETRLKERDSEIEKMKKQLEAALITTRRTDDIETPLSLSADPVRNATDIHPNIQTSLFKNSHRVDNFRMHSLLDNKDDISPGAAFFNDLDELTVGVRPDELSFWADDQKIKAICVTFKDGKSFVHGQKDGNPSHVLKLEFDEAITELEVRTTKNAEGRSSVASIAVATSKCNVLTVGTKSGDKTYSFSMADHSQWSFRGFFGFTSADSFEHLGIVWGKDPPVTASTSVQMPPAKNFLGMGASLQRRTRKNMSETKPSEHFYLGDCVSTGIESTSSSTNSFTALDTIIGTSKITKLFFSASEGRLSGLKVEYDDNKVAQHGAWSPDTQVWDCKVQAPILAAKLTVGKTIGHPEPFVDTVELVCGEENGELPLWPLDVSTVRYLGDHLETDRLEVKSALKEQAPRLGGRRWTLRGFYGEESRGLITRLGLIWGCA